jgi:hypothetical protein
VREILVEDPVVRLRQEQDPAESGETGVETGGEEEEKRGGKEEEEEREKRKVDDPREEEGKAKIK